MTIQKISLELQNAVVTDGTTITGDGTADRPLSAPGAESGVVAGATTYLDGLHYPLGVYDEATGQITFDYTELGLDARIGYAVNRPAQAGDTVMLCVGVARVTGVPEWMQGRVDLLALRRDEAGTWRPAAGVDTLLQRGQVRRFGEGAATYYRAVWQVPYGQAAVLTPPAASPEQARVTFLDQLASQVGEMATLAAEAASGALGLDIQRQTVTAEALTGAGALRAVSLPGDGIVPTSQVLFAVNGVLGFPQVQPDPETGGMTVQFPAPLSVGDEVVWIRPVRVSPPQMM